MVIKNHQITNWPNDPIHGYFWRPLVTSNSCSAYQTLFNWDLLNFWPIELSCRRTWIKPVTPRQNHRTNHRKFMIMDKPTETVLRIINLDGGSMHVSQPIWTVNTTMVATMANLFVMVFIGANGLRFVMRYVQRKGILDISPTGGLNILARTPRTIWTDYRLQKAYSTLYKLV